MAFHCVATVLASGDDVPAVGGCRVDRADPETLLPTVRDLRIERDAIQPVARLKTQQPRQLEIERKPVGSAYGRRRSDREVVEPRRARPGISMPKLMLRTLASTGSSITNRCQSVVPLGPRVCMLSNASVPDGPSARHHSPAYAVTPSVLM